MQKLGSRSPKKDRDDIEMVVERDIDEPTWEVRQPGDEQRTRRISRRTRAILTIAAVTAVVANAGAAWAYWSITGSDTAADRAGQTVELGLRGRNDLAKPLTPGSVGDLTVTVSNDRPYPIRLTDLNPGLGTIVADDQHQDAGCPGDVVSLTQSTFQVSWQVERNTIGIFTIKDGLTMRAGAPAACDGATFTVPLEAHGVRQRR